MCFISNEVLQKQILHTDGIPLKQEHCKVYYITFSNPCINKIIFSACYCHYFCNMTETVLKFAKKKKKKQIQK